MQQLCLQSTIYRPLVTRCSAASTSCRPVACPVIGSRHGLTSPRPFRAARVRRHALRDSEDYLEVHAVLRSFLSVGVSIDDFKRAQRLEPALLADYPPDRVNGILDLLLNLGLTGSDIGKVLVAHPQVFKLSLDHHAQPVVDFLRGDVGLGSAEIRTLVTRFPSVLGMNVKGHLRPQVHYLASLGVPAESLPSLVLSRPLVLGPGIDTVVNFLLRRGVARSQMHRLLRSYPLDYGLQLKSIPAVTPPGGSSSSGGPPPGGSSGGRGMGRDSRSK